MTAETTLLQAGLFIANTWTNARKTKTGVKSI
jgi:hypothetical protein